MNMQKHAGFTLIHRSLRTTKAIFWIGSIVMFFATTSIMAMTESLENTITSQNNYDGGNEQGVPIVGTILIDSQDGFYIRPPEQVSTLSVEQKNKIARKMKEALENRKSRYNLVCNLYNDVQQQNELRTPREKLSIAKASCNMHSKEKFYVPPVQQSSTLSAAEKDKEVARIKQALEDRKKCGLRYQTGQQDELTPPKDLKKLNHEETPYEEPQNSHSFFTARRLLGCMGLVAFVGLVYKYELYNLRWRQQDRSLNATTHEDDDLHDLKIDTTTNMLKIENDAIEAALAKQLEEEIDNALKN
jgi:hypothetical protein